MSSVVTPYTIFTVFSQLSVGALIAMVIADFLAKSKEDAKFLKTGAWVSVPAVVIALIAIISHEARPMQAMATMNTNLATSWLSREGLTLTIFVILAVIYTIMWLLVPAIPSLVEKLMPIRKPLGIISVIVGFIFIGVSARTYMMPSLPSLNLSTTPLFFVVTTLLAGVTAVAAVLSVKYLMKREGDEPLARMLWITMGITLVMVIVLIVGLVANISMLKIPQSRYAEGAQLQTLTSMVKGNYAALYIARWVIGVGLTLIFTIVALALPLKKKSMATASVLAILLFIVVLSGEIIGRAVFFGTSVPLGKVFPDIAKFYAGIGL